jgi:hypothetical protein
MRTIEIEGQKFEVRSLTRGEIKELQSFGYNYITCNLKQEKADKGLDKCLEILFDKKQMQFLDTCSNSKVRNLWIEILKETYGAPDEEKNLQSTSSGSKTGHA